MRHSRALLSSLAGILCAAVLLPAMVASTAGAAEPDAAAGFHKNIAPILDRFCIRCHNADTKKGGVAFDQFEAPGARFDQRDVWFNALKMLRAGLMPPRGKRRPNDKQIAQIEDWIKYDVFKIDPHDPDPGHVSVRRLNRVEYRNTIRDLTGVFYNTDLEFPPDDTGHGFDTIGEVLSLSPLLLEKYLAAARTIISQAVPTTAAVVAEKHFGADRFQMTGASRARGRLVLSYYKSASAHLTVHAPHAGHYRLVLDLSANERFVDGVFDYNRCRLVVRVDGKKVLDKEFVRTRGERLHYEFPEQWKTGLHELSLEVQPLTPGTKQVRSLSLNLLGATLRGPMEKQDWVRPANYKRFFPRPVPENAAERRAYARELLTRFATRAFRRPVDTDTTTRLVNFAERIWNRPGGKFEAGIGQAMTVVLASPRFLFREESPEPLSSGGHPLIDEYALASRLSYFLWSTMPDDELLRLAGAHQLRAHLDEQITRMLADRRSSELVRQFTGQWLQARDMANVEINTRAVMLQEQPPDPTRQQRFRRFRELIRKPPDKLTAAEKKELDDMRLTFRRLARRFAQFDLTGDLRQAMRGETESVFDYILHNDRSLLELLESDYTFVNERLARYYGIPDVKGPRLRRVKLSADSPRGGVLTEATVLITTSNPDRTSPVKRGLFILDNILGIPPAPPPPNLPPLEKALAGSPKHPPTLREALAIHRQAPLCSSCHNRMDPLGLAFEHFNALGRWRDQQRGQPIDSAGQLITGESFQTVRELKHILATRHHREFYRCLTEKMLTYALGRGLEYYDVETVDEIVQQLGQQHGRPSVLIRGIIASAPFQRCRPDNIVFRSAKERSVAERKTTIKRGADHASAVHR